MNDWKERAEGSSRLIQLFACEDDLGLVHALTYPLALSAGVLWVALITRARGLLGWVAGYQMDVREQCSHPPTHRVLSSLPRTRLLLRVRPGQRSHTKHHLEPNSMKAARRPGESQPQPPTHPTNSADIPIGYASRLWASATAPFPETCVPPGAFVLDRQLWNLLPPRRVFLEPTLVRPSF